MSVEAMALVLHHSRAKGTAKLVLLGIANHEGDGGAWPTVGTLARYANVTERAVQTCISQLVSSGELVVERNAGGSRSTRADMRPNLYRVMVACPWTCDHTTQHRARDLGQLQRNQSRLPVDNGVKQTSPGEAGFTSRGEPGFTRTTLTTLPTQVGALTTDRARGAVLCRHCNHTASVCARPVVQADFPHTFEAVGT